MKYLLIETDLEKFIKQEVEPDEFDRELRQAVRESQLEEIESSFDGKYGLFVTVDPNETRSLVPRLMAIKGIKTVFSFTTKPMA